MCDQPLGYGVGYVRQRTLECTLQGNLLATIVDGGGESIERIVNARMHIRANCGAEQLRRSPIVVFVSHLDEPRVRFGPIFPRVVPCGCVICGLDRSDITGLLARTKRNKGQASRGGHHQD